MIVFPANITLELVGDDNVLNAELITDDVVLEGELTTAIEVTTRVPEYEGSYEVTPSQETQILETSDKMATANIIINPIPQNYGLIEWNGQYLTVR